MSLNSSSFEYKNINGQKVLFPSQSEWMTLKISPLIDNIPIGVQDSVWSALEVVDKYLELYLGLAQISVFNSWMPYIFVKIDSYFQRGHLETLTCNLCNWKGNTINPMVIDPYLGDGINQDHFTLMKLAEKFPILSCPNCGAKLPRHPIWVEY